MLASMQWLSIEHIGGNAVDAVLVKPQFEVGRERVGKGGVVRDAKVRDEVRQRLTEWLSEQPGWRVLGSIESPITGPKGNIEYLLAGERGT